MSNWRFKYQAPAGETKYGEKPVITVIELCGCYLRYTWWGAVRWTPDPFKAYHGWDYIRTDPNTVVGTIPCALVKHLALGEVHCP